ncbi:GNAT family N-acetyltransferase [Rhizobium sp. TRM95111]|uniref:GNAT family N-acetyltransferase n=1 Tax=Rhizobium alarense TaxID=2846851 RepID=UPI001F2BBE4E|nr:GNAT family N-acetyltransferase [Rhizobium alarense]MCF3642822.1 GNAT family N-acetyltransferase [Rhizobium alarense]
MSPEIVEIGWQDVAWHAVFFRHVSEEFDGIDFAGWAEAGGWTARYTVFALVEGGAIVSTVGVSRMQLVVGAQAGDASPARIVRPALQLGAVATRADRRGKGLAARLMCRVLALADADDLPVLLFANSTVTGFYPRFGFRPVKPSRVWVREVLLPAVERGAGLDPMCAADRLRIEALCARSLPHRGALSAMPDPAILLWYLCNDVGRALSVDGGRSVIVVSEHKRILRVHDWVGQLPPNPLAHLGAVIHDRVERIEFGFLPPPAWFAARLQTVPDEDAFMFCRGVPLAGESLVFPAFLRT